MMSASKWKPYPKYLDKSSIDWLGEVPEQWDISTPRLMFDETQKGQEYRLRKNEFPFIGFQ